MKFNITTFFAAVAVSVLCLVSCQEETPVASGISNIRNSYADKNVSQFGGTITIKFDAAATWNASIKPTPETEISGKQWVSIDENTVGGDAEKDAAVRIVVQKNTTVQPRSVELWVTVEGYEPELVATLVQASVGGVVDAAMNKALNTFMHDILKTDYLWAEAYNSHEVDLTVPYNEFLSRHLLALGDENIEDGGYYKMVQANAGQRYIYSSLVEVEPDTRSAQTAGLGFGPFLSTALSNNSSEMAITPAYVRSGSPAEKAGLRRGDLIYAVNDVKLNTSNYLNYIDALYYNPSGTYTFDFLRFEDDGNGGYRLNSYQSGSAYAGAHVFNPVLQASILTDEDNPATKIGYLVYESFDLDSQEFLAGAVNEFARKGITDLILDLRFNYGGAVAQSRWLSGCIAGQENWSRTFCEIVYRNGGKENWTFGSGYAAGDNLGQPVDLGLERLYVIGSYNTASAAELVINSLRGIDFEVKFIGSQTEGKNVGMNVTQTEYKGRHFNFQPVTFRVRNAKGFGEYPDGFRPDDYVNNDNSSTTDDADNIFPFSFSDWGNMDYNIALQWAYCDITGKPRWTQTPKTKSAAGLELTPVHFQPLHVPAGKAGNLIF